MENQETSPKNIMLNYGAVLGLASVLIGVINYAFGNVFKPHWSISVFSTVVSIAVIVMGLRKIKEGNNGLLSLGQSLKTGLGITLISGIIYVVYLLIFMNFIEPDFTVKMLEFQEQTMLEMNPNMSDEQLEMSLEIAKKMTGTTSMAAMTLIGSLFFGFLISLVAGLIMKKSAA
jgi:hypothetical protein